MLTETALQLMIQRSVFVEAVYLDASHKYEAVKRDISHCWSLVDERGLIWQKTTCHRECGVRSRNSAPTIPSLDYSMWI